VHCACLNHEIETIAFAVESPPAAHRNAPFDRFVLTGTQVECLGAIEATSARDIDFGTPTAHRHDELGTQSDHRKWSQHFILRGKSGFSSPRMLQVNLSDGRPVWGARNELSVPT